MLGHDTYYFATTKTMIVAFGSIFENINIIGDHGNTIKVPLFYGGADKLVDARIQAPNLDATSIDIIFPAMGFELIGMNYAPERALNAMQMLQEKTIKKQDLRSANRVPYDFNFNLYVGTKKFEDSLKIVEQFIPFFSPEFTVAIHDREDFELVTNIPIVMNSASVDVQNEGTFDDRREITWTFGFTVKGYYYAPVVAQERIKQTLLDMRQMDFNKRFEAYQHNVVPRSASIDEPHEIIKTTYEGDDS